MPLYNYLLLIYFAPIVFLACLEFIDGNPFVRFITPGVALLLLATLGTIFDYFHGKGIGVLIYIFSVFLLMVSIWIYHLRRLLNMRIEEKNQIKILSVMNVSALKRYEEMAEYLKQTRTMRHEFGHHNAALKILCEQKDLKRIAIYLDLISKAEWAKEFIYSENPLVDSILSDAIKRTRDAGITFEYKVSVPSTLPISDPDLCSLLMNMLDNAIEASIAYIGPEKSLIQFQMRKKKGFLTISFQNTHSNHITKSNHKFISTKAKNSNNEWDHGYGISIMERIAEKYGSILIITNESNIFCVKTAIQIEHL